MKVGYLTAQFTRMWQRFQFFVALQTALVGGKKVKANESYTLATDDATAAGAGGLTMLAGAPVERVGLLDSEAVAAYLRRLPQPVEVGASSAFQSTRR